MKTTTGFVVFLSEDSQNCLLVNEHGPTIAAVGVSDMIVVSTPDAVLVMPKGHSQAVKNLVNRLAAEAPDLQ